MKFNISIRKIFGLIISAAMIMIYALYCSARVGYFLLLALILAPLFSFLLALYANSRLSVSADISHILLNKGNMCVLAITLKNRGFLPCPSVYIKISDNPHLPADNRELKIYASPRHESSKNAVFTAHLAGGSYIGIENAEFTDWFNICSFNIIKTPMLYRVGVIPEITRQETDIDLLESVSDAFSSDKSDDTIDETSFSFKGFAGYDYRPYEPGDPIKRINSKVSAKMGQLMIRLDEKQAASSVTVTIDPCIEKEDALLSQNILESALGIVLSLLRLDFSVKLHYIDSGEHCLSIHTEDELPHIAEILAYIIFSTEPLPVLPEELQKDPDTPGIIISSGSCPDIKNMNIYNCSSGEWRHA